jgi:DNA-binding CsgD family transcriptional regulator
MTTTVRGRAEARGPDESPPDLEPAAATAPDRTGIRVVAGTAEVQREIDSALARCADEFVSTHPGGPGSHKDFANSFRSDISVLKRGVSRRMLYQHTVRANLGMRSYVGKLAKYGGTARTTSAGFERMFIFDRHTAFIPVEPPGQDASGAAVITHPATVLFLYRSFERLWASALPFDDKDTQYDEASVDIKISLLRLMASGLKDEAIAHSLGVATRTCRRHMSAIMAELGAASRFQAGVKIAQLGILAEPDASATQHRLDAHPTW